MRTETAGRVGRTRWLSAIRLLGVAALVPLLCSCAELDYLRTRNVQQEQTIRELTAQGKQWEDAFYKLRKQSVDTIDEYKKQITLRDQEIKRLREQRSDREQQASEALHSARVDLQKALDENAKLEARLRQLLKSSETQVQELNREVKSLEADLKTAQADLAKAESELKTVRAEAASARKDLASAAQSARAADTQIREFKEAVESRDEIIAEQNKEIAAQKKEIASLQTRVSAAGESSGQVKQLQGELEKKDRQISQLKEQLSAAGESTPGAPAARALDASLQKARRQLADALKSQIEAGEAEILEKSGAVVLRLQSDLLFETATVMIRSSAKSVLDQVAEVLSDYPNYHLRVEGHTDSQPVRSMPFPDNLALSSQRAGNIVRYLVQRGRLPEGQMAITSAGRSYWNPIATNDTAEGRQKNRRVEIVLEPKA